MLALYAFILLSCSLAAAENKFVAKHCDVEGSKIALELISVTPKKYPFVVPGTVEADLKFKVNKAPIKGKKYTLEFKVYKDIFIFGYSKLPCLAGLGSCDFDFCDFLARKSKELSSDGKSCPGDLPCSCADFKAGTYDVSDFKTIIKKEFLPAIGVYGDYKADVTLVRDDTKETQACIHLEFTLVDDDECTGLFCP